MVQYQAERAGRWASTGLLLGCLDFRLLVIGQVISTCGDMLYLVSLPFLVFSQGGSPITLAATLTVYGLTRLAATLPAGALVDRVGPGAVMLAASAARGLAVAVLALAAATGRPTTALLMLVGAGLGAGEGAYRPAGKAITPALVAPDQLPAANAISITSNLLATIFGPALGGLGLVLASPALMFWLDAATFACSAVTLLLIQQGRAPAASYPEREREGEPRTVLDFLRGSAFFRVAILMMAMVGLSIAGTLQVALPVLARQTPALGPAGYGFLRAALGAGMVLGGVLGGVAGRRPRPGRLVIGMIAVEGLLLAALPDLPDAAAMLCGMAAVGILDGALTVVVITVLQRVPPPRLRGRVLGVLSFAGFAMFPISVAVAGTVVSRFPVAAMFLITGLGFGLVALVGAASRTMRDA